MTVATWGFADLRSRRRTSGAMAASVALHVLLLLWLALRPHVTGEREILTEVQYFDELPAAPAPAPVPVRAANGTQAEETRFARRATEAETRPEPQSDLALDDRIASRLDALRGSNPLNAIASAPSAAVTRLAAAPAGPAARGDHLDLSRGPAEHSALALQRGAPVGHRVEAAVAAERAPAAQAERPAEAPSTTRELSGAQISGPVADRPIAHYVMPEYPDWAKRDAVEGSVTVRFVVRPDGSIKDNVFVQKTAGFEDFDLNALAAIRAWRFAPLTGGTTGEQWGAITFHYRLRDAG